MTSHDRPLYIALDAKLIEGGFLLVPWMFSLKPVLSQVKGFAPMSKLHLCYEEISSSPTTPTYLKCVQSSPTFFRACGPPLVLKQGLPREAMPMKKVCEEEKEMTMCSAPWAEGVREHVYHLLLPINGSVVKEVHDHRSICPKFKKGYPFLILFLLSPQ